jgi:hypothetical protein
MKLGTENRTKTIAALALFAVALLLSFRGFFGGGGNPPASPAPAAAVAADAAEPGTAAPRRAPRRPARRQPDLEPSFTASLDPRLRLDLLKTAEETTYAGSGRNIFRPEAEPVIPRPVAPAMPPPEVVREGPPPPPPPPPINLKFFGFASSAGEAKKVFLVNGDDVFIAAEGEIVNRRYKIVRIGNTSVEVEDMLSNRRQTLPLTG